MKIDTGKILKRRGEKSLIRGTYEMCFGTFYLVTACNQVVISLFQANVIKVITVVSEKNVSFKINWAYLQTN